jgi:hypothetical protein
MVPLPESVPDDEPPPPPEEELPDPLDPPPEPLVLDPELLLPVMATASIAASIAVPASVPDEVAVVEELPHAQSTTTPRPKCSVRIGRFLWKGWYPIG